MIPVFFSSEYVAADDALIETTRKAGWVHSAIRQPFSDDCEVLDPGLLDEAALASVHSPAYVAAVRTGEPRELAESQGFCWDPGLWTSMQATNAGTVAAAIAALEHGVAGSLSSGLHHATYERGRSYCTFNGLVLAAKAAINAGAKRVVILDLDAHHGGGTASLIEDDERIWQLDVPIDSSVDAYEPANSRVLLERVYECEDYLPTISGFLDKVAAIPFDLCLYNAGMDPHEDCGTGGLEGITRSTLAERESRVFAWFRKRHIPIAFVLAGGYTSKRLTPERLTELHLLTIEAAINSASL